MEQIRDAAASATSRLYASASNYVRSSSTPSSDVVAAPPDSAAASSQATQPAPATANTAATETATPSDSGESPIGLDATSLSFKTRLKGFAICFGLGVVVALLGVMVFALRPTALATFGILYSLGNGLAIASTLFLVGPMNQLKRMFDSERWSSSAVMLTSLAMTLISAFWLRKRGLTIIFCLIQFAASTWYSLSYVPFARQTVSKALTSCMP